jgi:Fe-S cluster assembly protein SufD
MNLQNTFQTFNQTQKAQGPWGRIRQNGFRYFEQHGLPSKLDEEWKYTSLKNLPENLLQPQGSHTLALPKGFKKTIEAYLNPDFLHLVFLNGILVESLSDLKAIKTIQVKNLDAIGTTGVLKAIKKSRQQVVGRIRQDSMEALNSAFASHGIVLDVPSNFSLGKPLQVLYYQNSDKATYPKTLVKVGAGSKLVLIETFAGGSQKSLTSAVSEFVIEKSAKLEYTRIQEEGAETTHVGCTRVFLSQESSFESLSYATGAALNRHNFDVYCLGEQAFAQINGLTLGTGKQHHDNHTRIDHIVGACNTTQLYKSILDDESRAVFNGKVVIRKNAQKASSDQLNNNLILSSKAEADSKPELDIYADDVKAAHGSTVGQLNPDELFYFLSRAIPREKAVEMLSLGFVNDLIDRVSSEEVRRWLAERLLNSYQKVKGHLT